MYPVEMGLSGQGGGFEKRLIVSTLATLVFQPLVALLGFLLLVKLGEKYVFLMFADMNVYADYGKQLLAGELPYRDFLVEYPPLSLPLFLLPGLPGSGLVAYTALFGLEMLAVNAIPVYLIAREVQKNEGAARAVARLKWYTGFLAALSPLPVARFDLAAAALGFWSAVAWFSGRSARGGMLAGLGALTKLFPAIVAGPAVLREALDWRRGRGAAAFAATVALGLGGWAALSWNGLKEFAGYHMNRTLQVESLYAGLSMLVAKIAGAQISFSYDHKSYHLAAPWTSGLTALATPVQAAALLFVLWRCFRDPDRKDGIRYCAAAILAFVATSKILSPQFLLWPAPFIALLGGPAGRKARPLFLLACVLTTLVFPCLYFRLLEFELLPVFLLNARNLLLLALLGVLLFPGEERQGRRVSL